MASPFPGMDPYLETHNIWSGFHGVFLNQLVEQLFRPLRPKYTVRLEERVYITGEDDPGYRAIMPDVRVVDTPGFEDARIGERGGGVASLIDEPIALVTLDDDEIHERYIQVLDTDRQDVVTVIELLSPTNRIPGSFGRRSFRKKKREVFASAAHWLEIDLLRAGSRPSDLPGAPQSDYQVYLSRAGRPRRGSVWPFSIRDRLPIVAVPLRGKDPDVALNLRAALTATIERGSYDLNFKYSSPPPHPLPPEHHAWMSELIARRNAR